MIGERTVDGFSALTLSTPAAGGIEATFVPSAGMVGCSLRHRDEELLGLRRGLRAYVGERITMGIPLLYPWANRLGRTRFSLAGREVALESVSPPLRVDGNGLPMHGLLAGAAGWRVERHESIGDGAVLAARFEFGAGDGLTAAFPFPHALELDGRAAGACAHDHDDRPGVGRRRGADRVRFPSVPAPARRRPPRLGGRGAGPRAPAPRRANAPHRRARGGAGPSRSARATDVRRRLPRARRLGAVRSRRRRPADRARVPLRLPLRAGLRPRRGRRGRVTSR